MDGNVSKEDNHKTNKREDSLIFQDYDYWPLLLFVLAGFIIAHSENDEAQRKAKRAARFLRSSA